MYPNDLGPPLNGEHREQRAELIKNFTRVDLRERPNEGLAGNPNQ